MLNLREKLRALGGLFLEGRYIGGFFVLRAWRGLFLEFYCTFGLILIIVCHLKCLYLAWENSRHFVTRPLVSLWNDVWETSAEISYWWCVNTQIWAVLLIGWKFASTNQKHHTHPNMGSETSSVRHLCARSQTWFHRETSNGVAECRLFSQTKCYSPRLIFERKRQILLSFRGKEIQIIYSWYQPD